MDVAAITNQIEDLIRAHAALTARAKYADLSDLKDESAELVVRLQAAVDRIVPSSTTYAKEATAHRDAPAHVRIPALLGVLKALKEDIKAGWLKTVEELLHADTFADFLDMARELNSKGYKDAAAVIAGTVLESHLRLLCDKNGIPTKLPAGGPKKADLMNSDLAKGGVYNNLQQKQVTAWLGIRNSAAHGRYTDYGTTDVTSLVSGVEQFILNNPA
jgi:hypothetical protein